MTAIAPLYRRRRAMSDYDHAAVTRAERQRVAGPCDAERAYWPKFTPGEVAKHVSLKDGWIIIYERVFDITTFAITHPGFHNAGQVSTALAITRNLGKDCTEEFVSIHSATAWAQLHDFQIGVVLRDEDLAPRGPVAPEDVDVLPPRSPGAERSASAESEGGAREKEHPVPRRNHRPMPRWLSKDRNFWSRYGGGVDANVLRYLDAQGYAQSAGGVEDIDAPAQTVVDASRSSPKDKEHSKMRRSASGKLLVALAFGAGLKVVKSVGRLDDLTCM